MDTLNPKKRLAMIKAQNGRLTVTISEGPTLVIDPSSRPAKWKVKEFLLNADPDVIFLDLHLPLSLGTDLLGMIGKTSPGKKVVLRPLKNVRLQTVA